MGICLAYDSSILKDGVGAQTLRQIGIFSLSKRLELGYEHVPIVSVDSNPGDGINGLEDMRRFLDELEEMTLLKCAARNCKTHSITFSLGRIIESQFFLTLVFRFLTILSTLVGINILIKIANPSRLLKVYKMSYDEFRNYLGERNMLVPLQIQDIVRISVHIHWAMQVSIGKQSRYLELRYFEEVLQHLSILLKRSGKKQN